MELALNAPLRAIYVEASHYNEKAPQSNEAGKSGHLPPTDLELLARILKRDEAALGMVYDRYGRLVYAIALRITGNSATAEETVQDVFQAVWQSAASFQMQNSFVGWLIGITRHRAIDATRSRRYRERRREDVYNDALLASSAGDVYEQDDHLLLRETVRRALAALPPQQRQVIELAYYGGLTHVQIAASTGEPIGTVKSRIRMALLKLREQLSTVIDE